MDIQRLIQVIADVFGRDTINDMWGPIPKPMQTTIYD